MNIFRSLESSLSSSSILASRVLPFAALLAATQGCADTIVNKGDTIIARENCPADPNTGAMQYSWNEAQAQDAYCRAEAELDHFECDASERPTAECNDERDLAEADCHYWLMNKVNKLPLRQCGEPVFNIVGDGPSDANYGWEVNLEDYDGDGVNAWMEYWMGSNPCAAYSVSAQEDGICLSDGDLDYDADGILNGVDPSPICYGDFGEGDPAEYYSDCI